MAMNLGMEIFQNFATALEKSPKNPRVHFLKGISDLYTPAQWGGGPDPAIDTLTGALELFIEENPSNPDKPSWGHEEAHTFLAMAYLQKQDEDNARKHFNKAIEINPDYGLAREELKKLDLR